MASTVHTEPAASSSPPAPEFQGLADGVRELIRRAYDSCTETVCGADWDVVLTTYDQAGSRVLRWMDEHQVGGCGPVIANHEANSLMWLVPPSTVHEWPVECNRGLCFGGPFKILLPPAGARNVPGPHWKVPQRLGHLVDPACLRHALDRFQPEPPVPVMRLSGDHPALPLLRP